MNPGYVSTIIIIVMFILMYYKWTDSLINQLSISPTVTAIILCLLYSLSNVDIPLPGSIYVNVGSIVLPLFLFSYCLYTYKKKPYVLFICIIIGLIVYSLNEILHIAPIVVFLSLPLLIAFVVASIGYFSILDKQIGLISGWMGVVIGESYFQMSHYSQFTIIKLGGYALLDVFMISLIVFLSFMGLKQIVYSFVKRRESIG